MRLGDSIEILIPHSWSYSKWYTCKVVSICATRFCIQNPMRWIFGQCKEFIWFDVSEIDDSDRIYDLKIRRA